ncbi:hypothetical protein E4U55_004405 [Claviceps digitariae]|nr:hypothetical protein E4U55_004405 [Claviceps digitariae]
MTSPLSPVHKASLNKATPPSKRKYDQYEVHARIASMTNTNTTTTSLSPSSSSSSKISRNSESPRSSPFVSKVAETTDLGQENMSPSKSRHSRVMSGTELSPLRILEAQRHSSSGSSDMGPPPQRNPRRLCSPESRFPVKIGSPRDGDARATKGRRLSSMDDVLRQNEGPERSIEIFDDERSGLAERRDSLITEIQDEQKQHQHQHQAQHEDEHEHEHGYDETAAPDDSMISTLSTFSVVPNLTVFANLGHSPAKHSAMEAMATMAATPLAKLRQQESFARPPSSSGSHGNTSNLLMDFTDQMRFPNKSPAKRSSFSPSRPMPNAAAATPNGPTASLLDFDIPPMPTPRSLPSITPRELESLKSGFLSEISSLKASLSGKEAEVHSLKAAVGDAETRVGKSLEQLHEERALKEQLAAEKEDWEKRGRDMGDVLRKVREEIMTSQHDRDELEQKLEESEKRREAAELLHQEAESKLAGMRAGKECGGDKSSNRAVVASPDKPKVPATASPNNKEVEMAVERVARELHALYKSKHETKVAALKKSYESRWEKRVKELESRIEELSSENEKLRDREVNMTRLDPDTTVAEERVAQAAKDGAAIRELSADVQRLEAIVSTVKRDNKELRTMLEKERVEKGELVLLAEEMMSMQAMAASGSRSASTSSSAAAAQAELQKTPAATRHRDGQERGPSLDGPAAKTPRPSSDVIRNSNIARSAVSGLRAPGSVVRPPGHTRRVSGGLPRPGRSGIMSSIEKMGSYRGRGQE